MAWDGTGRDGMGRDRMGWAGTGEDCPFVMKSVNENNLRKISIHIFIFWDRRINVIFAASFFFLQNSLPEFC